VSSSRATTSPDTTRFSSSTGTPKARDVGAGHPLGAQARTPWAGSAMVFQIMSGPLASKYSS